MTSSTTEKGSILYMNGHARRVADATHFREAPHNIEAEQALLGAILVDNEAMKCVSTFLEAGHFFDPIHSQIYEAASKTIQTGKKATPVTLQTFFVHAEPIDANLTVPQYLGRLAANATTVVNAEDYGRTIYDLSLRRSLIMLGEDVVASAYDAQIDSAPKQQIDRVRARLDEMTAQEPCNLKAITLDVLMRTNLAPRRYILDGFLQERGIAMLHAWRGGGKTWVALGAGYAIATGGSFLKWRAERPCRVLHVCGEMPAVALRDRLTLIAGGAGGIAPAMDFYRVLSADLQKDGIPDLATREGQSALDRLLGGAEVLILDNASTLFRSGIENDAESWLPVQQWLLRLRRQGLTIILVHHSGKGRTQRGTSKREDILDVVIALRVPTDYEPSEGARFQVHFEKARGLAGRDVESFEAALTLSDDKAVWTVQNLENAQAAEIEELSLAGQTVRQIAAQLGISKSGVQRAIAKLRKSGGA